MWTLGTEKRVQYDLSALDFGLEETINYLWENLLSERERKEAGELSSLGKVHTLLKMAFVYGQNSKTLQTICGKCDNVIDFVVDALENLKFEDGELEVDSSLPLKEWKEREKKVGSVRIEYNLVCPYCGEETLIVVGLEELLRDYLFSFNIRSYLDLVLFLKEYNFSMGEIEGMIPLEVNALVELIRNREKEKAERKRSERV